LRLAALLFVLATSAKNLGFIQTSFSDIRVDGCLGEDVGL